MVGEIREDIKREAHRLYEILGKLTDFRAGNKYDYASCLALAPLTLEIKQFKKTRKAVVLAHYYCTPDIVYGVADYRGDSYALAKIAAEVKEDIIMFCGVSFMAQTAKIINPQKRVFLPAIFAGCSLAEGADAAQVKELRQKYPAAQFVCYINSTAAVKAQCDVCVTSSNVYDIIAALPARQIVFLPDVYMAANIKAELARRGIDKEVIPFGSTCCVHDKYSAQDVKDIRLKYPQAKIICHPECAPEVCALCDYAGGTGGMLQYVKGSAAQTFAVLSEDGIVNCLEYENPGKDFLHVTKTCASMKRNTLGRLLSALESMPQEAQVEVPPQETAGAKRAIDQMFKMTEVLKK